MACEIPKTEYIVGEKVLNQTISLCESVRSLLTQRTVVFVIVDGPPQMPIPQRNAPAISLKEKIRNTSAAGFHVAVHFLPHDVTSDTFVRICHAANEDANTIAICIQLPLPVRLSDHIVISGIKNIDAIDGCNGPYSIPTASEAVLRLVSPWTSRGVAVALVGSNGFIGRGIATGLSNTHDQHLFLDLGDDLLQVRSFQVVISATGCPMLLDDRHISSFHELVVDVGFYPMAAGFYLGDISHCVYSLPRYLTPVPGGIGPLQMAVFLERLVFMATSLTLPKWDFTQTTLSLD